MWVPKDSRAAQRFSMPLSSNWEQVAHGHDAREMLILKHNIDNQVEIHSSIRLFHPFSFLSWGSLQIAIYCLWDVLVLRFCPTQLSVSNTIPSEMVANTNSTGVVADLALPVDVPESQVTPANVSHAALFSLTKKTIAITGAGRGLGITLAAAVLEAGGNVACLDILDEPAAEEWAAIEKTAKAANLLLSYRRVDITDEENLSKVLDEVAAEGCAAGSPFYGAIACAGIQQKIPAVEYPKTDFERILSVNVTGTFLTAKHSARILIESGVKGSIVMIGSMSGEIANRVSNVPFPPSH